MKTIQFVCEMIFCCNNKFTNEWINLLKTKLKKFLKLLTTTKGIQDNIEYILGIYNPEDVEMTNSKSVFMEKGFFTVYHSKNNTEQHEIC